jgi:hypothetical protein
VMAPNMVGLVRFAGGWLFDRVMAGWDTTVLVADPTNVRPLQILGARVADLEAVMASSLRSPRPHALAVDASLYISDRAIAQGIDDILDKGGADIMLWGSKSPLDMGDKFAPLHHQLSLAARAFKAQALAAAAASVDPIEAVETVETFRSSGLLAPPRQTA